jgi:hypothetical protein
VDAVPQSGFELCLIGIRIGAWVVRAVSRGLPESLVPAIAVAGAGGEEDRPVMLMATSDDTRNADARIPAEPAVFATRGKDGGRPAHLARPRVMLG